MPAHRGLQVLRQFELLLIAALTLATCGHPAYAQREDDMRSISARPTPKTIDCSMVRWAVKTFPRAFLLAEAKRRNISQADQDRAAKCIKK